MKGPLLSLIVVTALVGLGWIAFLQFQESRTPPNQVARHIRARLQGKALSFPKSDRSERARTWSLVRDFYKRRSYQPAWSDGRGPDRQSHGLVEAIAAGWREGLDPADYDLDSLKARIEELDRSGLLEQAPPAARLSRLDLWLTYTYFLYADHLLNGRIPTSAIDPDWVTTPREVSLVETLKGATVHHQVREALAGLLPKASEYARLREAFVLYAKIAQEGRWPSVPGGRTLRAGVSDRTVALLRSRLQISGDLRRPGKGARFDGALVDAVKRFQARHGLEPSGIVDPATRAAMNVPVEARMREIQLNLARWRWLPPDLGKRYVAVNVPDFRLDLVEGRRRVLSMRVVVGKLGSPTPLFTDRITHVEVNPFWNIPNGIAANEIAPLVHSDESYLARNRIRIFSGAGEDAREVNPSEVDWGSLGDGEARYSLRQDPGPENPLGNIKFMSPNEYNVYLHDTPAGHLFDVKERGFSHGCIRVERPLDLAEHVLGGASEGSCGSLLDLIESGEHKVIGLPEPIPVHILYWTAWVDEGGIIQFRDDLYGHDQRLNAALRSGRAARFWVNVPAEPTAS